MAKTYSSTAPGEPTAATAQTTRRALRSASAEPQQQIPITEPVAAAKRGKKSKAKAADLPTVDEDEIADNHDETEAQLAQQLNVERESRERSPRRISGVSAISGTTAKSSFSQEEIEQLDYEVILDVLPLLASASDSLGKFLAPEGTATAPATWKEIRLKGSKHNKLYKHRLATLQLHKPAFGTQEYIQPRIVLSALLGEFIQSLDDLPPAKWRPDNILFKANLTQMLNSLLVVCDTADWTERASDALERLDMAFPVGIAGGEFSFAAIELWLNLAAQLSIRRLEAAIATDPNFSPHEEIANVFYDEDGDFKHKDALGFMNASDEDTRRAAGMVEELIKELQGAFKHRGGKNATASNGKLKSQFRWDDFIAHVLRYYESRATFLDESIAAEGGIERILQDLAEETERRANAHIADQMKRSLSKTGSTPRRSLGGKGGIAALKAKEMSNMEPSTSASIAQAPHASVAEDNEGGDIVSHDFGDDQAPEPDLDTELATEPSQSAIPASTMIAMQGFQDAQKRNKSLSKARLTDRQEGAVRIDTNMDDFDETQREVRLPPNATNVTNKRKRAGDDDLDDEVPNPSQDEGFQEDTRDHSNADELRRQISFNQVPRNRFPSVGVDAGPSNYGHPAPSQASPSKRQRKNPGSAIPEATQGYHPEDPAPPHSTDYQQYKVEARINRVNQAPKPTQVRQPWTASEEAALMELIENEGDEGISYAALKAYDNELAKTGESRLTRRSAEDLRFKSRNMKVTMLLAGAQLPKNWEKVALDKKAVDRLEARGVHYKHTPSRARSRILTQGRETDGGERGTPTPRPGDELVHYEYPA